MSEYYKHHFQCYHENYIHNDDNTKKLAKGAGVTQGKNLINTSKQDMDQMITGLIDQLFGSHLLSSASPLSEL